MTPTPDRVGNTPTRRVAVLGAPSSIGIRPYDDGQQRQLDRTPATLRALNLVTRLGADDLGDVFPPPYCDFTRPPRGVRNEEGVAAYSRALAGRVASGLGGSRFLVVLGGDCSIVLGSLLGAGAHAPRIGLAYIDAHADFATPQESRTGSAASMCLALAVGHGDTRLARLGGHRPLARAGDVVLVGRRDVNEPSYGHAALAVSGILDIPGSVLSTTGSVAAASAALDRLGRSGVDGFWIHLDADVLNPVVMPAVDSPEPGGPGLHELSALIGPLVGHPKALGLQLTIYDPRLDPDRTCARRIVELLERVLEGRIQGGLS
jgi:arginase